MKRLIKLAPFLLISIIYLAFLAFPLKGEASINLTKSGLIDSFELSKNYIEDGDKLTTSFKFSEKQTISIKNGDYLNVKLPYSDRLSLTGYQATMALKNEEGIVLGRVVVNEHDVRVTFNETAEKLENVAGFFSFDAQIRNFVGESQIENTTVISTNFNTNLPPQDLTIHRGGSGMATDVFYYKTGDMLPSDTNHVRWFLSANPNHDYVEREIEIQDQIQKGHELMPDSFNITLSGRVHNGTYSLKEFNDLGIGYITIYDNKSFYIRIYHDYTDHYFSFFYLTKIINKKQKSFDNHSQATFKTASSQSNQDSYDFSVDNIRLNAGADGNKIPEKPVSKPEEIEEDPVNPEKYPEETEIPDKKPTTDGGTQTDPEVENPSVGTETETPDKKPTTDGGTQTDPEIENPSVGTETETPDKKPTTDGGTQTDPEVENPSVGTETETPDQKPTTDGETQTDPEVENPSVGTETETPDQKPTTDGGTQTDPEVENPSVGTETEIPDKKPTTDGGTQTDPEVENPSVGTETETPDKKPTTDGGTQTDPEVENPSVGTETEIPDKKPTTDGGTQTDHEVESPSVGTETETPDKKPTTDGGTQTDHEVENPSVGTETETPDQKPTTDGGTQTDHEVENPSVGTETEIPDKKPMTDGGTQTDPEVENPSVGTETETPDQKPTTDGGTQTDPEVENPSVSTETETPDQKPMTDGGTQTDPEVENPSVGTETETPDKKPTISSSENLIYTDRQSIKKIIKEKNLKVTPLHKAATLETGINLNGAKQLKNNTNSDNEATNIDTFNEMKINKISQDQDTAKSLNKKLPQTGEKSEKSILITGLLLILTTLFSLIGTLRYKK